MTSPLHRIRALPLRSRLAMLVATAVAVAVAAVALACWLTTRDRLIEQLDSSLRQVKVDRQIVENLNVACLQGLPQDNNPGGPEIPYTIQVVTPTSKKSCTWPGKSGIPVQSADRAVAAGERQDAVHTTEAKDGAKMRVYTSEVHIGPLVRPGLAVSVALPMEQVTAPSTSSRSSSSPSPASVSSARAPPGCGSPAAACAPSTSSPRPSSMSPAPRTSRSASRSRARTRSPGCPAPSTR